MIQLAKDFEALPSDTSRWRWLKNNQRRRVKLYLDDGCYIQFNDGTKAYFDFCLEWSPGTFALLDAYGIKADRATGKFAKGEEVE